MLNRFAFDWPAFYDVQLNLMNYLSSVFFVWWNNFVWKSFTFIALSTLRSETRSSFDGIIHFLLHCVHMTWDWWRSIWGKLKIVEKLVKKWQAFKATYVLEWIIDAKRLFSHRNFTVEVDGKGGNVYYIDGILRFPFGVRNEKCLRAIQNIPVVRRIETTELFQCVRYKFNRLRRLVSFWLIQFLHQFLCRRIIACLTCSAA